MLFPKLLVLIAAVVVSATTGFLIPSIELPAPGQTFSQTDLAYFRFVLEKYGVVAFTKIPGFTQAREKGLLALGRCHQANQLGSKTLSVPLSDGMTTRTTLAAQGGEAASFPQCLARALQELQDVVFHTSLWFALALDSTTLNSKLSSALFKGVDGPDYKNFTSVIAQPSAHLDHFHVYEKSKTSHDDDSAALDTHTDQGLFVAVTPSISLNSRNERVMEDSFQLVLPDGSFSTAVFPDQGDCLMFMIGDGMSNFIRTQDLVFLPRAAPHRLLMNSPNAVKRMWFGRMFFPPPQAFLSKQLKTFQEVRQLTVLGGSGAGIGCTQPFKQELRDLTEANVCDVDQIYCWMGCKSTAGLTCSAGETIECVNQVTHQLWTDETQHCFDCTPDCYSPAPPDNTNDNNASSSVSTNGGICNPKLSPTNMYMNGFNWLGPHINCVVFLFQPWVLDTQVKYAFGSLGAFLVSFTVELIIMCRRTVKGKSSSWKSPPSKWSKLIPDARTQPRAHDALMLLLYFIQLVLAYFAMLLAMTFAVILFFMVMLGFVVGHFTFNFYLEPRGNEACCNATESVDALSLSSSPNTSLEQSLTQQHQQQQQQQPNCCGTYNNDEEDLVAPNCCGAQNPEEAAVVNRA